MGRGGVASDMIPDTPGATTLCLPTEDWEKGSEARKGKNRRKNEKGTSGQGCGWILDTNGSWM